MRMVITEDPAEAAEFIKKGGICAFPTETVYGLGAGIFDETAIARIFAAKGRPADNPLIAHVSSTDQIAQLSSEVTQSARKLIDAFFPGPLTVVVVKAPCVPLLATAGLDTIGIRMPALPLARRFIGFCGTPVVAPSANLSGRPSPTTWEAVREDLDGRIDCILKSDATEIGLESTVVDCTGISPLLLRKGSISIEQLRKEVPEIEDHELREDGSARSPGMKHRHYSPDADVIILEKDTEIVSPGISAFIGLKRPEVTFALERICRSVDEYAKSLFAFFRECDAKQIKSIYCEAVEESGIGAALMDRLRRASEH